MTTSYDLGALKEPEDVAAVPDPRDIILPRPGFGSVLANHDFRLIWSAQVASQLADKFLMFALLILTYSISRASTHGAALFLAYTFPSVFLSPLAGVYADRHDKKRLMFFTNAIRGVLILLIPLSQLTPYFAHVTWHLLVITFLFAAVGQIFAPAEAASIPFIVSKEELMTATSMFTSTVIVTLLVAVPLSTLAVRFLGENSPYWIAAGL
ncbi:MAG: MFS transporter, partial [Chloroflexi bacterium]